MNLFRSLTRLAVITAGFLICLIFIGATPVAATEVIWHSGDYHILESTVWRTGEIHAIADDSAFGVDKNVTLTIEPGVIVKIGFNSIFRVNGELAVNGTADDPVYFVSLRDDTIGGDTNGDGSATTVASDDWRSFEIDGNRYKSSAQAEFNYAVIKHGGRGFPRGTLFYLSSVVSFMADNCNIIDNKGIIFVNAQSKNVSITNSNIYNSSFCNYASSTDECHWDNSLRTFSTSSINLLNNYWGSPEGPTFTTGVIPTVFKGVVLANLVGANMSWQPFATKPFEFGVKKINPVIVIPGLMGSWQNWQGEWEIDPILHTYDDLLDALRLAGYQDGKTLFTFPYQWRQSNALTADELKNKINAVKSACSGEDFDCSKVDLVAHSMGGLVARAYAEGDGYEDDIDQLIFIATPHKGAPKAYLMWEGGEMGVKREDKLTKQLLSFEAWENGYFGEGALMRYTKDRAIDSVKELLPIYHYLFDSNGETDILRHYPNNYPINPFLENLNNPENLSKLGDIKILNILGDTGLETLNALYLVDSAKEGLWEYGMPKDFYSSFENGLFYGEGDGIVPRISNTNFFNCSNLVINQDHSEVVSYTQKAIVKELTGQEPETEIHNFNFPDILLLTMHSPADFAVIAPDGKKIGRDFSMSDLTVINEIAGAFYSGFNNVGTAEFVVIPNPLPGEYRIIAQGTGDGGSYSISADFISEATSTSVVYSGQILPGQERNLSFNLSADHDFESIIADITIDSAIGDVSELYDRGLLLKHNNRQKIIQQYELLRLKLKIADKLVGLARQGLEKLLSNAGIKGTVKEKLIGLAEKEIEKLKQARSESIGETFRYLDEYLNDLAINGLLKPLGYDIIKANNEYLKQNL